MSRLVVFRPQAAAEVVAARSWYDAQHPRLGNEFGAAFDGALHLVTTMPESFPKVHGDTRRALLRRFPYALYFRILPHELLVLAVVHGHRDPAVWRSRR
jgi:plasmid stabilization system protein ParE